MQTRSEHSVDDSFHPNVEGSVLLPSDRGEVLSSPSPFQSMVLRTNTPSTTNATPSPSSYVNNCPFRQAERQYKWSRAPQCTRQGKQLKIPQHPLEEVDLTNVIDVRYPSRNTPSNNALLREIPLPSGDRRSSASTTPPDELTSSPLPMKCFACDAIPGLYIFPSCIGENEQALLCRAAVLEYGNSSNFKNMLSTHVKTPHHTRCYQPPMRWATVGFNYQWTSKTYQKEEYSRFPSLVRQVMMRLGAAVFEAEIADTAVPSSRKTSQPDIYQPQSGIVNYFPVGTSMMAHQDAAEDALTQPLLSLSLGCSCIFLMGTESMMDSPTAFLLRSGDLAAFAGPSRLCFHSVARILDDVPSYLTIPDEEMTDCEKKRYHQYSYYHHLYNKNFFTSDTLQKDTRCAVGNAVSEDLESIKNDTHLEVKNTRDNDLTKRTAKKDYPQEKNSEWCKATQSASPSSTITALKARTSDTNSAARTTISSTATAVEGTTAVQLPLQHSKEMLEKVTKFVMIDPTLMSEDEKERYWRLSMKHMRINVNARQVYPESCDFIFCRD